MKSGLVAEFNTPEQLLVAARRLRKRGLQRLDAHTPWPVKGMAEILQLGRSPVARDVLVAGLCGAVLAYFILWYTSAWSYPLIVGSRPPHSAPAFIPITFETTVLFAGVAAIVSVLARSGLPRLWDPLFDVDGFERAFVDRFWLSVDARDPLFDFESIRKDLTALGALRVVGVANERPA